MMKIYHEDREQITYITIHNPEKRNAFDREMAKQVINILNHAMKKKQRVIVLKAKASHGVFSAGHNLEELASMEELEQDTMFEMIDLIGKIPIPVIAKVNGAVYAGALHLLMICDMVYATNDAKVVMTANKMGLPFSLQHYHNWLSVVGIHKVKELFFTASEISAEDAYHAGIFNAIFNTEEALNDKIQQICDAIIRCCDAGIANSKLQLNTLANNVMLNYSDARRIEQARSQLLSSEEFQQRVALLLSTISHKKT